jgi:hypothetical protein
MAMGRRAPLVVLVALAPLLIGACDMGGPGPETSWSRAVSDRIAAVGRDQDWYAVIGLVNGRPAVVECQGDCSDVMVRLTEGVESGSPLVVRACRAIAAAVNSTQYGPSLNVTQVDLFTPADASSAGIGYSCNPPQATAT